MIVYLARDIPQFVMYCVNGKPRSSLFIESTDSMIYIYIYIYIYLYPWVDHLVPRGPRVTRNAQRANVGPAGLGSMVNVIALKTATLVLSRA